LGFSKWEAIVAARAIAEMPAAGARPTRRRRVASRSDASRPGVDVSPAYPTRAHATVLAPRRSRVV
jgi:hypothetical protein